MIEPTAPINTLSNPEGRKPLSAWKRVGISLATALTALLSLVSIIMPVAVIATWNSSPMWPSVLFLVLTVSTTAGLFWLALRLYSLLKAPATKTDQRCQCCATDAPTIKVGINRHIGAIFLMFHKSFNGHLCKSCIKKLFWEYTPITFFLGWWGIFSVIITPIVLINNIVVYVRSLTLETSTPPPLSPQALPEVLPTTRVI